MAALTSKSVCKELRPGFRAARRAGWRIRNGGQHVKAYPTDGGRPVLFMRGQKANHSSIARKLDELRSHGLEF